jgi:hypothetical protein
VQIPAALARESVSRAFLAPPLLATPEFCLSGGASHGQPRSERTDRPDATPMAAAPVTGVVNLTTADFQIT